MRELERERCTPIMGFEPPHGRSCLSPQIGAGSRWRPLLMLDTQPPGAPDAGQMDAEALLALTEDDLMAMPQELADQARELQSQVKDERDEAEKERQKRVQAIGQRIVGTYNTRLGQRRELEIRWN